MQAVAYLVLHAKQKKSLAEIQGEMCPELSVQQLYRISTMYWDDKYNTETVSGEVLQEMRSLMQARPSHICHLLFCTDSCVLRYWHAMLTTELACSSSRAARAIVLARRQLVCHNIVC
jgi:myosin V